MRRLFPLFLILISFKAFCQKDTVLAPQSYYQLIDKEHFYQYCKNCKSDAGRPKMLCGHNYSIYSGGYSYSGEHWLDVGFSKDIASCYPEKGGHLFSAAIIIKLDKELVNGIKLSYLRDNLFGFQFYYLKFGINLEGYTDYHKADFNFRPEIRIADNMDYFGLLTRVNLAYGYNVALLGNNSLNPEKHQFSIILFLRRKGWIS